MKRNKAVEVKTVEIEVPNGAQEAATLMLYAALYEPRDVFEMYWTRYHVRVAHLTGTTYNQQAAKMGIVGKTFYEKRSKAGCPVGAARGFHA